jgi:hypothetical protein
MLSDKNERGDRRSRLQSRYVETVVECAVRCGDCPPAAQLGMSSVSDNVQLMYARAPSLLPVPAAWSCFKGIGVGKAGN